MRTQNQNFSEAETSPSQSPRYVIEIAFDTANTDLHYFTSHANCATPELSTVTYSVINTDGLSSISQTLDPLQARSTIGSFSFDLVDVDASLTTIFNTHLVALEGLRKKRVRVYMGFDGFAWEDYVQIIPTQLIDSVSVNDGLYSIKCADVQRELRKDIFDAKKTTLINTIPAPVSTSLTGAHTSGQVTFTVADTTLFTATGSFKVDNEFITYTGKTATTFTGCSRGTNGSTAADHNAGVSVDQALITITVADTSAFSSIIHGTSFQDSPSATVGYVKIDREVFRWTAKTSNEFTGCTRAVLGTIGAEHKVDSTASNDRKLLVEEYIYLELPGPKMALALMTGTNPTLPAHWHMGISSEYVQTSAFQAIGKDLWDTSNDSNSEVLRFTGLTKTDGKKFIEEEIGLLQGTYMPIISDGSLSLRRMVRTLSDAPYVQLLDETNVISYGEMTHDMEDTLNQILVNWNYNDLDKKFTRSNALVDAASITTHQKAPLKTLSFKGLHGSRHTDAQLATQFDALRDRYSAPPKRMTLTLMPELSGLDVGDVVRIKIKNMQDYTDSDFTLDSSFEIYNKSVNWITGEVTITVLGSSGPAGVLGYATSTVMADEFYNSAGTDIATLAGYSLVASVGHLTSNLTLTGNADATAGAAIYYLTRDLTIDPGVTITITDNVQLRIKGLMTVASTAKIDGKGRGLAGVASAGVGGFTPGLIGIGSTKASGLLRNVLSPLNPNGAAGDPFNQKISSLESSASLTTGFSTLVQPKLINNGTSIIGLPNELRGTSGGPGGDILNYISLNQQRTVVRSGGSGGNGGSGLMIVGRGISVDGIIDLSGNDGVANSVPHFASKFPSFPGDGGWNEYAGTGAGGHPGGLLYLRDGASANVMDSSELVANLGFSITQGERLGDFYVQSSAVPFGTNIRSHAEGFPGESKSASSYRMVEIPKSITASEDVAPIAPKATAIVVTTYANTPQTPGQNLASLEIGVTPPSAGNYAYSNVYYRVQGQTAYQFVGPTEVGGEAVIVAPMDGITYEIAANPVSISGVESTDFISTTTTVASAAGNVTLGAGNNIKSGQTAFDSGLGWFLGNDAGLHKFSIGDSAGQKMTWDGISTLSITGTISATTGVFGGWTVSGNTLSSASGGLVLDAQNNRARFTSGANYVEIGPTGIKGVDGALGTTFSIPVDGSAPTFSRETRLLGASSYQDDALFYHTWFDSVDRYFIEANGSATYSLNASGGLIVSTGATAGSASSLTVAADLGLSTPSWGKARRFKGKIQLTDFPLSSTGRIYYGIGTGLSTSFGFHITSDGTSVILNGFSGEGGATTTTLIQNINVGTAYVVEAVFNPSVDVKFYVNGMLLLTITTNLPLPTSTINRGVFFKLNTANISTAADHGLKIYEHKYLQDP